MKKYLGYIILTIVALILGFFLGKGCAEKQNLNLQNVAFTTVDAMHLCYKALESGQSKTDEGKDINCKGYEETLATAIAADPKKEDTIARISAYLDRSNDIPNSAKERIKEVLNK
jgi:hypothetical protein